MKNPALLLALSMFIGATGVAEQQVNTCSNKTRCEKLAVEALAESLKISAKTITSLGSAVVGDGAAVVEINILSVVAGSKVNGEYQPSPLDGGYTVEFQNDSADTCDATKADADIRRLKD